MTDESEQQLISEIKGLKEKVETIYAVIVRENYSNKRKKILLDRSVAELDRVFSDVADTSTHEALRRLYPNDPMKWDAQVEKRKMYRYLTILGFEKYRTPKGIDERRRERFRRVKRGAAR